MKFCLSHFQVGVWSCSPMSNLLKYLKLLFNDEDRLSLKFCFGKERLQRMGLDGNKDMVYVKMIEPVFLRMPHLIRENVILLDSPFNTYCNPFWSSLYPSIYNGDQDDTFLRDDLIPFLLKLFKSESTSWSYVERNYPDWSENSLFTDWKENNDKWKYSRCFQEKGDLTHLSKFRDYQIKSMIS